MKHLLLTFLLTTVLISCSGPLSKQYSPDTLAQDIEQIRKTEGDEKADLIAQYMATKAMQIGLVSVFTGAFNKDDEKPDPEKLMAGFEGKTYGQIYNDAMIAQKEEEVKKEKKRQEEEKERQELLAKVAKKEKLVDKINNAVTFAMSDKGFMKRQYVEYVTCDFVFENKTDRTISGIKGIVVLNDIFGEEITRISLSYDKSIAGMQTMVYTTKYNEFMDGYRKLKNTEYEKIKVEWEPEQLIFEDGEILK